MTTSWVTKDGHDFARRLGRIRLIECEEIKYLCKEHLGLDVLISLPKPRLVAADPTGVHAGNLANFVLLVRVRLPAVASRPT